jgi:hypothetical protein
MKATNRRIQFPFLAQGEGGALNILGELNEKPSARIVCHRTGLGDREPVITLFNADHGPQWSLFGHLLKQVTNGPNLRNELKSDAREALFSCPGGKRVEKLLQLCLADLGRHRYRLHFGT